MFHIHTENLPNFFKTHLDKIVQVGTYHRILAAPGQDPGFVFCERDSEDVIQWDARIISATLCKKLAVLNKKMMVDLLAGDKLKAAFRYNIFTSLNEVVSARTFTSSKRQPSFTCFWILVGII